MKISTRHIVTAVAVVALFFTSQSFAQSSEDSKATRFGIGVNVGVSTDDPYGLVLGGDLRLQQDFSSNVSGILSAGYTNFSVKNAFDGLGIDSYDVIPVKAGIKVFPVERFYISGEIGAGFGVDNGSRTAFIYAPGIGIGTNSGLDLGLRYEGIARSGSSLGQVALRIAYGFKLTK